jgi:hypothetical protein
LRKAARPVYVRLGLVAEDGGPLGEL